MDRGEVPALAKALRAVAEEVDCNEEDALAAAIVELMYDGCFVVPHTQVAALRENLTARPLAPQIQRFLGEALVREIAGRSREMLFEFIPLMVLDKCAVQHPSTIHIILHRAIELVQNPLLTWENRDEPPIVLTTTTGTMPRVLPAAAQRAVADFRAAQDAERREQDPTINGRPHEALTPSLPRLADSFSSRCLELHFMLESPRATEPAYVETIRLLGAQCLRTMPQAHEQARAKRLEEPGEEIDDRYGSEYNQALPRYARWLLKAGDHAGAKEVCEMALRHRIEPSSPGAFERALAAAEKKLQPASQRTPKSAGKVPTATPASPATPATPSGGETAAAPQPQRPVSALFRPKAR